jgi:hypothetical protein
VGVSQVLIVRNCHVAESYTGPGKEKQGMQHFGQKMSQEETSKET